MTEQETSQAPDEVAYNGAWQAYRDAHRWEYRQWLNECTQAQRVLRGEVEADRMWSDLADTCRWQYDNAIVELQRLDRAAHEAGMNALTAVETLKELAR